MKSIKVRKIQKKYLKIPENMKDIEKLKIYKDLGEKLRLRKK